VLCHRATALSAMSRSRRPWSSMAQPSPQSSPLPGLDPALEPLVAVSTTGRAASKLLQARHPLDEQPSSSPPPPCLTSSSAEPHCCFSAERYQSLGTLLSPSHHRRSPPLLQHHARAPPSLITGAALICRFSPVMTPSFSCSFAVSTRSQHSR
jgi:hypothetical protein